MGNYIYAVLGVGMASAFVGNVEQIIPNNINYYISMMLPF